MSNWLDLRKIAESGQCFRWRALGGGAYEIHSSGRAITARQTAPDTVTVSCGQDDWRDVWFKYFDMDNDYASCAAAVDPGDEYLRAAAEAARGLRMLRQDFWETLVSFIISQNNNIPRITGILARLCALCGGFPEPNALAALSVEELTGCGLGYRAAYIKRAAQQYLSDKPDGFVHGYDYAEAREYLTSYHGVGPKVADCVCLYGLGHRDAFPRDVWVKRIEAERYGGRFPQERYPGFAGVLQLFMFWYERLR